MANEDVGRLRGAAAELSGGAAVDRWLLEVAAGYLAGERGEPAFPGGATASDLVRGARVARGLAGEGPAARAAVEEAVNRAAALLDAARSGPTGEEYARYLSFLSHDLRGGLNGILLMIEVLKRQLGDREEFAEQVGDLDMMRRSVLDTVSHMDHFIYGERFKRGLVKVRPGPVHFGTLADQLTVQFAGEAEEHDVKLTVTGDGRGEADRSLVLLAAVGLIGNAIKYCKGAAVNVELAGLGGAAWRLVVADCGKGLPDEVKRMLDAPSNSGGEVRGLGLVRMAAEAMGAAFSYETSAAGTTFRIEHG